MKKSFYVSLTLAAALLFTALPVKADAAGRSAAGFPLPTTSTYTASALSHYSGGAVHRSYLYTYGAMRNAAYDPYCVVDIPAPWGTPIYAVADGTVCVNTYDNGGGNYLVLRHNDGTYSYYGHMRERSAFAVGGSVQVGDVLGYVGMTGTATGYHLHFEWSGHDPYCEYSAKGYITGRVLAATVYPHQHTSTAETGATNVSCTITTGIADTITQTSAVLRGTLSASGVKATECGMFLGTSRNNMQKLGSDSINTYSTSFFYSTVKYGRTLTPGTTYYYQAYAKAGDTTYYGEIRTFQTPQAASCTVTTGAADTITQTSAVLRGTLSASGVKATECGIFLGTSRNNMQKLGSDSIDFYDGFFFYSTVKYGRTLTPGTTYYYQAYAKAGSTTYYGDIRTFQTPQAASCTVTTGAADTITQTSAVLRGTLSASVIKATECGIFLGTSRNNMQKLGSDSIDFYDGFFFYSTVEYGRTLTSGTTYYYQAYARAGNTTYYGEIRTFQTPPAKSN